MSEQHECRQATGCQWLKLQSLPEIGKDNGLTSVADRAHPDRDSGAQDAVQRGKYSHANVNVIKHNGFLNLEYKAREGGISAWDG